MRKTVYTNEYKLKRRKDETQVQAVGGEMGVNPKGMLLTVGENKAAKRVAGFRV